MFSGIILLALYQLYKVKMTDGHGSTSVAFKADVHDKIKDNVLLLGRRGGMNASKFPVCIYVYTPHIYSISMYNKYMYNIHMYNIYVNMYKYLFLKVTHF